MPGRPKSRPVTIAVVAILCAAALAASGMALFGRSAGVQYAFVQYGAEIAAVPNHSDQLLVTDFGTLDRTGGQVIIVDFKHRVLWKYSGQLSNPHSAYFMPNGDIIISDTGNNRVIEVDRQSKIVWNTDDLGGGNGVLGQGKMSDGSQLDYPNDAKPLDHGKIIMISCRLQNRIIEIDRTGKIVRTVGGFINRQHNPDILTNGDMLVADSGFNRVLEIDKHNKIVWQYGSKTTYDLAWPRDSNLLPNGDVLIADSDHSRIIEVNKATGKVVRQWTGLQRPYSVLTEGINMFVGDGPESGVVELNQKNHIVWKLNHDLTQYLDGLPWQVANNGFEDVESGTANILSAWHRNDALAYSLPRSQRVTMVRDTHVHHSGSASGRITYHGDSNGVYFSQLVRVKPGKTYNFSGWIRTHDVKACHPCSYGTNSAPGQTAEYEVSYHTGQGSGGSPAPSLERLSGTTGWVDATASLTIPAGVQAVEIDGYLRGQGTVWFDDVSLTPAS